MWLCVLIKLVLSSKYVLSYVLKYKQEHSELKIIFISNFSYVLSFIFSMTLKTTQKNLQYHNETFLTIKLLSIPITLIPS